MPRLPLARLAAPLAALALAATALPALADPRLIVQFAEDDVEAAFAPKSRVERLGRDLGVGARYLRRMALGAHVVELPEGADVEAAAAAALANGAKIAIPDRRRKALRASNDPIQGWYLANVVGGIDAYGAWDLTTGLASTVIAVVDTGVLPHPDLSGRVLPGYDMISSTKVSNDGDGRDADPTDAGDWLSDADLKDPFFEDCEVRDSSWHGTMVSGVIAARSDNGYGIPGLDWGARILPVRALGKCGGADSDILDGAAWAAGLPVPGLPINPNVAQVINMSIGGLEDLPCSAGYNALLAQVLSAGGARAIVAAAGNDGGANADFNVPSSCPATIAVVATTNTGARASYSNQGASVEISAPGGSGNTSQTRISTIVNRGATTATTAWGIALTQGTSFATPMVSGVIGLMLAVAPDLTPEQVRWVLASSATPFPPGSDCTTSNCGAGIVNARAAVVEAQAFVQGEPHKVPAVEYYNAGFGHYFMTADAGEIAGIDAGAYNGAFARTGRSFDAWDAPAAGTVPVCRFFTTPGNFGERSSHFYTADAAECAGVKQNPNWIYEKIAFYAQVPSGGACAAGTLPVYRAYNNGRSGAPNHRFTTDAALYQQLTTVDGWSPEGIRFCAPR